MKGFIIIALTVFNVSCIVEQGQNGLILGSSGDDSSQARAAARTRRGSVGRLCSGDSACEGICEDLFDRQNEIERCFDAPKTDVDKFEDILKVLKKPLDEGSLSLMDIDAFESLLKVSLSLWIPITREATSQDAKALLGWIASSDSVSYRIYEPYYYNYESVRDFFKYEGIENLLIKIGGGGNCQSVYNSIRMANIAGRKSFWDITKTPGVNNTIGRRMVCDVFQRYCAETKPSNTNISDSWTTAYYDMYTECQRRDWPLPGRASVSDKAKCREAQRRLDEAERTLNDTQQREAIEDITYYCTL